MSSRRFHDGGGGLLPQEEEDNDDASSVDQHHLGPTANDDVAVEEDDEESASKSSSENEESASPEEEEEDEEEEYVFRDNSSDEDYDYERDGNEDLSPCWKDGRTKKAAAATGAHRRATKHKTPPTAVTPNQKQRRRSKSNSRAVWEPVSVLEQPPSEEEGPQNDSRVARKRVRGKEEEDSTLSDDENSRTTR